MAPTNPTSPTASRTDLTPQSSGSKKDDDNVSMTDAPKEFKVEANESIKVALPQRYQGDRKHLETFLLQMDIYFNFNEDKFEANYNYRTLFAISYLTRPALEWAQPYLDDFMKNEKDDGSMVAT